MTVLSKPQKIALGVTTIAAVVVVAVVVVLVLYFNTRSSNNPPPGPPGPSKFTSWDCVGGTCVGYADAKKGHYKSVQDCMSQAPECKQRTACWLKTQDSLAISPPEVANTMTIDDINKVLSQKDADGNPMVYGQDMVVQCTASPSTDPDDVWSRQFCQGNQLQVCQKKGDTGPYGKCMPFFSAVGTQLQLTLQPDKTLADRSKRKFVNSTAPSTCAADSSSKKKFYRGVCLDTSQDAAVQRWTQTSRPYGVAFYHGGKTGLPEFDPACAASYLKQITAFVNEKNMNRVFLSVDAPLPAKQNPYFLQPQFLVKHFLANLNLTTVIGGQTQPMEVGVIVYANPEDSSWNFQYDGSSANPFLDTCKAQWAADKDKSLFPVHDDASMCFSNPNAKRLLGGRIDTPNDPTTQCSAFQFSEMGDQATVCAPNCETSTCADRIQEVACTSSADCDDWVGKNCMPYATQGTTTCASDNKCTLQCTGQCAKCAQESLCCPPGKPCYCPNVASQVVAYVTAVNETVDRLFPKGNCPKLTLIAYDGEDAKANKDAGGQCQFSAMVDQLTQNKVKVENIPRRLGWAFSMNATPFDQVDAQQPATSSFVMPEMYWYMGVNWPCMGSAQEYTQTKNMDENVMPCTSQIAYRDALADGGLTPTQFYRWMTEIQPCTMGITGAGPRGNFKSVRENMIKYPGQVWPMYSSESLSSQDEAKPSSSWCLARMFNAGNTQPKICGTADMLYSWTWDQITELLDTTYQDMYLDIFGNYAEDQKGDITQLLPKGEAPYLALYEAQFINPQWMNSKQFDPVLAQACEGACEDKLVSCTTPTDGSPSVECANFIKNNASLCANYTGYCKADPGKTDVCHFDPPKSSGRDEQQRLLDQYKAMWAHDDPACQAHCSAPGGCKCRYNNSASECPSCVTSSDCGMDASGNAIECVPASSSQCTPTCTDVDVCA